MLLQGAKEYLVCNQAKGHLPAKSGHSPDTRNPASVGFLDGDIRPVSDIRHK